MIVSSTASSGIESARFIDLGPLLTILLSEAQTLSFIALATNIRKGGKTKKTIFVGGIGEDVDEQVILETFSTFGDIIDVRLPTNATGRPHENTADLKHHGYAFVAYSSVGDAQDAINNMDMNELRGRILKVSIARPTKGVTPATAN